MTVSSDLGQYRAAGPGEATPWTGLRVDSHHARAAPNIAIPGEILNDRGEKNASRPSSVDVLGRADAPAVPAATIVPTIKGDLGTELVLPADSSQTSDARLEEIARSLAHLEDLTSHVQQWAAHLDAREARLNAREALLDHRERTSRISLQLKQQELDAAIEAVRKEKAHVEVNRGQLLGAVIGNR